MAAFDSDIQTRALTWREVAIHCALLAALLVPTYPGVFFQGELLSSADMLYELPPWDKYAPDDYTYPQNPLMFDPVCAFRPDYLLVQDSLRAGEWPLWNDLEYTGVPLLANCQSTVFYPPRLLLLFLDVDTAMTVFVLFKLWLCGLTAFICARLMGLADWPSRFFSIAWMLGSYNLIWGNWPLPDVSAWVPVVFVGCEFLLRGQYRRGFAATALGGTMILYAGHPETAFTFVMGIGLYFAARLAFGRYWGKRLIMPIAFMGLGWAVSLLVYAPQLLTFIEYLTHSYTFYERYETELNIPIPGAGVVATWVARFYGTLGDQTWWDKGKWNSNIMGKQYVGLAVWFGVMWLLLRGKSAVSAEQKHRVWALWVAAAIGIQLAFWMPTLGWVHGLPLFSSIHEIYHICFTLFALPLLGTLGLQRWFERKRSSVELAAVVPLFVIAGGLIYWAYDFGYGVMESKSRLEGVDIVGYVQTQIWITVATTLILLTVFCASCVWYRPRLFWALLTVLFCFDQWIACRFLNPTLPPDEMYPDMALTEFMQEQGRPVRFGVSEAAILSGGMTNYRVEEWLGYDGLMPERVIRYQNELGTEVWDHAEPVSSINFYLHDPNPEYDELFPREEMLARGDIELHSVFDGLEVYKNLRAFPRASLVGGLRSIPDRDAMFDAMVSPGFRPEQWVITDADVEHDLPESSETRPGTAAIAEYGKTRVVIDVNAERKGVLVLTDAYYPGWHARIDGEPVDILPAYYLFRGVLIEPGEHEVVFEYFPRTLVIGLGISGVALFLSSGWAAWWLVRRQRRPAS